MGQGLSSAVLALFETQAITDFYAVKHGEKWRKIENRATLLVSPKLKSGAKESMDFFIKISKIYDHILT